MAENLDLNQIDGEIVKYLGEEKKMMIVELKDGEGDVQMRMELLVIENSEKEKK